MLFEKKPQNRRFKPHEEQLELELCKWMKRPKRTFFYDDPFYPWLPPAPCIPSVNFDLGFNKGQH